MAYHRYHVSGILHVARAESVISARNKKKEEAKSLKAPRVCEPPQIVMLQFDVISRNTSAFKNAEMINLIKG